MIKVQQGGNIPACPSLLQIHAGTDLSTTHSQFVGSIPEIYDLHLGPLLFEFSAQDLAERVRAVVPEGGKILEVACGTGISTEYLHQTLRAATEVVADAPLIPESATCNTAVSSLVTETTSGAAAALTGCS